VKSELTFSVDTGFYLLQPAGLDAVSELLQRSFDVANFDAFFVLLVESAKRSPRSCKIKLTHRK